jgi:hypothetical protein
MVSIRYMPPDQLLRWVFETCETYAAAKSVLENTPVTRPVIYTLIGCAPGERCVSSAPRTALSRVRKTPLLCQVLALALTAVFWGRWQAKLSRDSLGSRSPHLANILKTHWLRTLLVNAYAAILLAWTIIVA